ncbi:neuropeptide Y receptor type 2-like isoform X2 [Gordionus sp. m RMFG-2023]|uniref:neuropeptide Y receptor type 2-like isoform X2 n=1 Tax=Gordionus sp. m RMFG-2023 TaxID=3053472 RepID=UPI0031FD4962
MLPSSFNYSSVSKNIHFINKLASIYSKNLQKYNFNDSYRGLQILNNNFTRNSVNFDPYLSNSDKAIDYPYALSQNPLIQIAFYFIYFAIFIVAVSGNSLVLYVVSRNTFMQTPTNIFITNLAASDLIMNFIAVPFTPLSAFLDSWIFGKALCHLVPMVQGCAVYISTLTLTAIALDRYQVMFHPFATRKSKTLCFIIILGIWCLSITLVAPLAIFMKLKPSDNGIYLHCEENWPFDGLERIYSFTTLMFQYFVPLCVIAYCYIKVSAKIGERVETKSRALTRNRKREKEELKRKDRTNRMLIAMVAIFAFCWLPINLIHVVSGLRLKIIEWKYFVLIFFVCHVIAMSSTCYNPMIYAWMNENFRKEFKAVLPCFNRENVLSKSVSFFKSNHGHSKVSGNRIPKSKDNHEIRPFIHSSSQNSAGMISFAGFPIKNRSKHKTFNSNSRSSFFLKSWKKWKLKPTKQILSKNLSTLSAESPKSRETNQSLKFNPVKMHGSNKYQHKKVTLRLLNDHSQCSENSKINFIYDSLNSKKNSINIVDTKKKNCFENGQDTKQLYFSDQLYYIQTSSELSKKFRGSMSHT